jgi:hypothetical protein
MDEHLIRAACRGFKIREGEGYPPYPGSIGDPEKAPEITDVLKRGADVNAADPRGFTALMIAANLGLVENVNVLLAHGADVKLKAKEGESALSLAEQPDSSVARVERRQVVELLRAHLVERPFSAAERKKALKWPAPFILSKPGADCSLLIASCQLVPRSMPPNRGIRAQKYLPDSEKKAY